MKVTANRDPKPPVRSITITLDLDEALQLHKTITSSVVAWTKHQLFDSLSRVFKEEGVMPLV